MISDMHVSRGKGSPSLSPSAGPVAINRPTQLNAAGQSLNKLAREVEAILSNIQTHYSTSKTMFRTCALSC